MSRVSAPARAVPRSGRRRATSSADQRNVAEVRATATPAEERASTRPPIAGPAKLPTLSIVLEETFAAVSASGDSASDGSSAASAGRNIIVVIDEHVIRA